MNVNSVYVHTSYTPKRNPFVSPIYSPPLYSNLIIIIIIFSTIINVLHFQFNFAAGN